ERGAVCLKGLIELALLAVGVAQNAASARVGPVGAAQVVGDVADRLFQHLTAGDEALVVRHSLLEAALQLLAGQTQPFVGVALDDGCGRLRLFGRLGFRLLLLLRSGEPVRHSGCRGDGGLGLRRFFFFFFFFFFFSLFARFRGRWSGQRRGLHLFLVCFAEHGLEVLVGEEDLLGLQ